MEKYLYWFAHGKPYVPYETMIQRMVESTFSSNNMYGVVDDHGNCYRSIVMDAIRMNRGNAGECSFVDKESNADASRFFDLLKYSD
jgi:hypothetical protein